MIEEDDNIIYNEEDIRKKVRNDIAYIENEVIAKQIDGNYCKWSHALKAVSIIGQSAEQFCSYWEKQYKQYPEYIEVILKACVDKLVDGLTPPEQMIEMIRNSHDFESEKIKAIRLLGGRYKENTPKVVVSNDDSDDEKEVDEDE